MQSIICLPRLSNSPPLKMQCAQNNQEEFAWVVTWAKRVKRKEWISEFKQCGAISQVVREQLTNR